MRSSWKIGRFAGVDTHVHWTFLLLVAWAAWASYSGVGSSLAAVLGVLFLFAVFASVLLHELGHALVARVYGVRTRGIVLTPLGGIAQLEGMPRSPRAELHVALAGPIVNLVIAGGLALVHATTGLSLAGLVDALMIANVTLALFNLIPAFPMDGGRVLRALLAMRLGSRRATDIAVGVGKLAAIGFAIAGLLGNPMLLAIAVFVWLAGAAEARSSQSFDTPWLAEGGVLGRPERVAAPWWAWSRPAARTKLVVFDPRVHWR
jgi:Zn-dependent protease